MDAQTIYGDPVIALLGEMRLTTGEVVPILRIEDEFNTLMILPLDDVQPSYLKSMFAPREAELIIAALVAPAVERAA